MSSHPTLPCSPSSNLRLCLIRKRYIFCSILHQNLLCSGLVSVTIKGVVLPDRLNSSPHTPNLANQPSIYSPAIVLQQGTSKLVTLQVTSSRLPQIVFVSSVPCISCIIINLSLPPEPPIKAWGAECGSGAKQWVPLTYTDAHTTTLLYDIMRIMRWGDECIWGAGIILCYSCWYWYRCHHRWQVSVEEDLRSYCFIVWRVLLYLPSVSAFLSFPLLYRSAHSYYVYELRLISAWSHDR